MTQTVQDIQRQVNAGTIDPRQAAVQLTNIGAISVGKTLDVITSINEGIPLTDIAGVSTQSAADTVATLTGVSPTTTTSPETSTGVSPTTTTSPETSTGGGGAGTDPLMVPSRDAQDSFVPTPTSDPLTDLAGAQSGPGGLPGIGIVLAIAALVAWVVSS